MQFLKVFVIAFAVLVLGFLLPQPLQAQTDSEINSTYEVGTVTQVVSQTEILIDDQPYYVQELLVKSNKTGQEHLITAGSEFQPLNATQVLSTGSQVVISEQTVTSAEGEFVINDVYRLPVLGGLAILFVILVVVVAGRKGLLSIAGMLISLIILISFIVPHILNGENPILITIFGASVTAVITMYLSHGFKRQTHIALFSMLACLAAVAVLSGIAVQAGHLVGLGSEEAAFLQFGATQHINLQGLLLAGILLGVLGILDDITLAQTSVIEQLKATNPKITLAELYTRGLEVGKDHVASLVNTLVFAYAGTSLPLFLLFIVYQSQPTWVILNSQIIAEEVVRTLVGSIGLVMAVPITTAIASYYVSRAQTPLPAKDRKAPHHHH